jgi:hypothetical protein
VTNYPGGWGSPPTAAPYGAPASPPVPVRPQAVTYAVWLMYAGAALSVVNGAVEALMARRVVTTFIAQFESQLPPGQQTPLIPIPLATRIFVALVVIGAVINALLWLWMAWKNSGGKSWARVLSTVFFGLFCVSALSSVARFSAGFLGVLVGSLVIFAVGLAVVILIWQREASQYYQAMKATDAFGRGQGWPPAGGYGSPYGAGQGGYGSPYGYGSPQSTYGYAPPTPPQDQPQPPPPEQPS